MPSTRFLRPESVRSCNIPPGSFDICSRPLVFLTEYSNRLLRLTSLLGTETFHFSGFVRSPDFVSFCTLRANAGLSPPSVPFFLIRTCATYLWKRWTPLRLPPPHHFQFSFIVCYPFFWYPIPTSMSCTGCFFPRSFLLNVLLFWKELLLLEVTFDAIDELTCDHLSVTVPRGRAHPLPCLSVGDTLETVLPVHPHPRCFSRVPGGLFFFSFFLVSNVL